MNIFVDADSCPAAIRPIIEKAAERREIPTVFVANRPIPVKKSSHITFVQTGKEEGAADDWIAERALPGDLVITRDIPLAARLLEKEASVINDRGVRFTSENIRSRLSERDIMKEFYQSGLAVQGLKSFGKKEIFEFANCFDAILTKLTKKQKCPRPDLNWNDR